MKHTLALIACIALVAWSAGSTEKPRHERDTAEVPLGTLAGAHENKRTTDRIPTAKGDLVVSPLDHASILFAWDGRAIYVDPTSPAVEDDRFPKADIVLVTEAHFDHLDAVALERLRKPGTVVVGPRAVAERTSVDVVLNEGDTRDVAGISVRAVPLYARARSRARRPLPPAGTRRRVRWTRRHPRLPVRRHRLHPRGPCARARRRGLHRGGPAAGDVPRRRCAVHRGHAPRHRLSVPRPLRGPDRPRAGAREFRRRRTRSQLLPARWSDGEGTPRRPATRGRSASAATASRPPGSWTPRARRTRASSTAARWCAHGRTRSHRGGEVEGIASSPPSPCPRKPYGSAELQWARLADPWKETAR